MTRLTGSQIGVVGVSVLAVVVSYLPGLGATTRTQTELAPHLATTTCSPSAIVARWSLDRLIEQLIVIPVDQTALPEARTEVAAGVGGMILTGSAPADLKQQLSAVLKAAPDGISPLVMADEEGGTVQRLSPLIGDVPSARTMGETMTPAEIERRARSLARSMRDLGLTMDLAPVADIDARPGPSATNADGTRAFSGNTTTTVRDVLAFAKGLEGGGIIPVVKHFPGIGGSVGNTDYVSASTPPWKVVEQTGLIPFERAIASHVPAVMVSNAVVPGLSRTPASLSRVVVTGELRGRLHFRGLILTDSLSAVAIRNAYASLGELSQTTTAIVLAVRSALAKGRISRAQMEHAAAMVLSVKRIDHCSAPIRS